ncbi:MAG: thiolase family protein [Solirubrobacterales bacterium]|nr:thiolase family protein [Solirubrobacterales bacterium]
MSREPAPTDTVIVEAVRTAIGRGHPAKGDFRDVHAAKLLGTVYAEVIERAGIDAADVDEAIAGCVQQFGEQMLNVGRTAWLQEGLPLETAGTTVDFQCGSSQQALNLASGLVASGAREFVIGAGLEHMGHIPISIGLKWTDEVGQPFTEELFERYQLTNQGVAAERVADKWGLTREELDEWALKSHQNAARAQDEGRFDREIVGVETPQGVVNVDQGVRRETTMEALGGLKAAFEEGGKITAGNASQISDGASAILVGRADRVAERGLKARARIVDHCVIGVDPVLMLTGPIEATRLILERTGMTLDEIDLYEVNEAFAPVVGAWVKELDADPGRVNVNGGAMALGHPLGCSGTRLITTVLHELERTEQRYGLVTMCCAGGLGTATLIERV